MLTKRRTVMKIFDLDGPVMRFLGNAFDFFMIFLMTTLLCIPVITAGAALTAAQYVSMKIMRKEAPAVFASYFKAFRENFKQATLLWLIQLVIIGFVVFDWIYVLNVGWANVFIVYRAFLILATCVVTFVNLTMYGVIARFQMKSKDVMKTAFVLSLANFPFLAIVVLLLGVTAFCCIWFFNLLPAFFVIGCTGATALHGFVMMRACSKLEKKFEEINEASETETEEASETDTEGASETDEPSAEDTGDSGQLQE